MLFESYLHSAFLRPFTHRSLSDKNTELLLFRITFTNIIAKLIGFVNYLVSFAIFLLFEKVKSALVWILLILNTMINSLDFTNSKDCFYSYGLY